MKRILSLGIFVVMLSSLFTVGFILPVSAAIATFTDDFESYAAGTFTATTKWGAVRPNGNGFGTLSIIEGAEAYDGGTTKILNLKVDTTSTASISDAYVQKTYTDLQGEMVMSFKVKVISNTGTTADKYAFAVLSRSGGAFQNIFDIYNGNVVRFFGNDIAQLGGTRRVVDNGEWLDVAVKLSVGDRADITTWFGSLFINGEMLVGNRALSTFPVAVHADTFGKSGIDGYANTAYLRVSTATGAGECRETYVDDFDIREVNNQTYAVTTMPANNAQSVPLADNTIRFNFGALNAMNGATFTSSNISVTCNGTLVAPSDYALRFTNHDIFINFMSEFEYNSEYMVTLSSSITNIKGDSIPAANRTLTFSTAGDPNNIPPVISILSPRSEKRFDEGSNIHFTVHTTDSDGTVEKVQYYNGSEMIFETTTSPFDYTMTNTHEGSYTITCKAVDNGGASSRSPITYVFVGDNSPSIVQVTSPSSNAILNYGLPTLISVNVADADGEYMERVEAYVNGVKVGETISSAPYVISYTPSEYGTNMEMFAKAYDSNGNPFSSSVVTFDIKRTEDVQKLFYDFNSFTSGATFSDWTFNTQGVDKYFINGQSVDTAYGNSLRIGSGIQTGVSAPAPFVMLNCTYTSGVKAIEAELRFNTTEGKTISVFTARSSEGQFNTDISVRNNAFCRLNSGGSAVETLKEITPNKWYKIKQVYYLADKKYDFYIDNVKVVSYQSIANQSFKDIANIRFTYESGNDISGQMFMDNVRVFDLLDYPMVAGVSFRKSDNSVYNSLSEVPIDISQINIKFAGAMSNSDMRNTSKFTILNLVNGAEVAASGTYNSSNFTYSLVPSANLELNTPYIIKISGSVRNVSNYSFGSDQQIIFTTKLLGITDMMIKRGENRIKRLIELNPNESINFSAKVTNNSEEVKKITLVMVLYNGNETRRIISETVTVSANQTQPQEIITDNMVMPADFSGCSVKGYVIDGFATLNPLVYTIEI